MRLSTLFLCAAFGAGAQQLREVRVPFAGKELTYVSASSASATGPAPLLVLLHPDAGSDLAAIRRFATNWQGAPARRRWHLIVPWAKATGPAVNEAGVIFVEEDEVSLEGLQNALGTRLKDHPSKAVLVRGDKKVVLGRLVEVMDAAREAGAVKIAIATQPKK